MELFILSIWIRYSWRYCHIWFCATATAHPVMNSSPPLISENVKIVPISITLSKTSSHSIPHMDLKVFWGIQCESGTSEGIFSHVEVEKMVAAIAKSVDTVAEWEYTECYLKICFTVVRIVAVVPRIDCSATLGCVLFPPIHVYGRISICIGGIHVGTTSRRVCGTRLSIWCACWRCKNDWKATLSNRAQLLFSSVWRSSKTVAS